MLNQSSHPGAPPPPLILDKGDVPVVLERTKRSQEEGRSLSTHTQNTQNKQKTNPPPQKRKPTRNKKSQGWVEGLYVRNDLSLSAFESLLSVSSSCRLTLPQEAGHMCAWNVAAWPPRLSLLPPLSITFVLPSAVMSWHWG